MTQVVQLLETTPMTTVYSLYIIYNILISINIYIYISLHVNDLVKLGLLTLMIRTYYYLIGTNLIYL